MESKQKGGLAQRLTTIMAAKPMRAFADGATLAFSAQYEGPNRSVHHALSPAACPHGETYEGDEALVVGWTPDGKIIYSTEHYSRLPDTQLATIDPQTQEHCLLPLSQASDGSFNRMGLRFFLPACPFMAATRSVTKVAQRKISGNSPSRNLTKGTRPKPSP